MKEEQPSIKRNYIFKLAYQILAIVTPLITAPYISRVLGADGVGTYSYVSSVMTYFTMFAALGTVNYGTREIAQNRDDNQKLSSIFWGIEIMTVCTTLVALIVWSILICFSNEYKNLFLALIPLLVATAADISWLYTGLEKVHYTVIWNFVCKILGIIAIFALIKDKNDLTLYTFVMSAITCFGNVSMWLFLPGTVGKIRLCDIKIAKHFRESLKYFLTAVAISVYTVLDKTMIGLLTSDPFENGYYEQANKIIGIVKPLAFTSINDVMTPRMSYLFAKGRKNEINDRIDKSLNLEFLVSIGCCFGIMAVSANFVPVFFGKGYEPVITLTKMLAPILIFICISTCLGSHYYLPSGNILQGTKLTMAGSIVNIIVNVPLIFRFGAKGAVAASLLAEGVIAVLYVHYSRKEADFTGIWKQLYKKLMAGGLMYLLCSSLGAILNWNPVLLLLVQVILGTAIYALMLLILRDTAMLEILDMAKRRLKWRR